MPIIRAKIIIPHSTQALAKKPRPTSGKLVNNRGTTAQCTAHKVDAVIPILSSRDEVFCKSIPKDKTKCNTIASKQFPIFVKFYFNYIVTTA